MAFRQLAERHVGFRGMAGGDEAAGWSAPRGRSAGSRRQGIPIRRAGSGTQPDAARRRREMCILPLPQGRAAPLGAGSSTPTAPIPSASRTARASSPKAAANARIGAIHASLPPGSELASLITSARSAFPGASSEAPPGPFGSIFLISGRLRSQPPLLVGAAGVAVVGPGLAPALAERPGEGAVAGELAPVVGEHDPEHAPHRVPGAGRRVDEPQPGERRVAGLGRCGHGQPELVGLW